jgi:hypothetical protein
MEKITRENWEKNELYYQTDAVKFISAHNRFRSQLSKLHDYCVKNKLEEAYECFFTLQRNLGLSF